MDAPSGHVGAQTKNRFSAATAATAAATAAPRKGPSAAALVGVDTASASLPVLKSNPLRYPLLAKPWYLRRAHRADLQRTNSVRVLKLVTQRNATLEVNGTTESALEEDLAGFAR
eukprot:1175546-Prorocentrum_minimum.AAC.3